MRKVRSEIQHLRSLCKKGKTRLDKLKKDDSRSKTPYYRSEKVGKIVRARNSGVYMHPENELFDIKRVLEDPKLTSGERFSLNRRRKALEKLTSEQ